jgi:hypothetical protein
VVVSVFLEPLDGVVAGVVVGEDLGEEDGQGDRRGVDALAPEMRAVTASGFDEIPREQSKEGESFVLLELIANGIDLAADGAGGRLSHGDLLGCGKQVAGTNHQLTTPKRSSPT